MSTEEYHLAELEKIRAAKRNFEALPLMHQLATVLHEKTCNGNHVDYCAWDYESNADFVKVSSTRNSYLKRAESIVQNSGQTVVVVMSVIKALR